MSTIIQHLVNLSISIHAWPAAVAVAAVAAASAVAFCGACSAVARIITEFFRRP